MATSGCAAQSADFVFVGLDANDDVDIDSQPIFPRRRCALKP
jgi:hypothetical protein